MHLHGITLLWLFILLFSVLALIRRAALRTRTGPPLEMRPSEILSAIQQAPVLEQPRAGKAYLGAKVRWHVTFESAIVLSPVSVRLMLMDRGDFPWVLCDVHKRKYPQLNGLIQHAPFWVSGQISKIEGDEFTLKNVRLEFEG